MLAKQLNIRDPEAARLAAELSFMRSTTITQAVIDALSLAIAAEKTKKPLAERLEAIADAIQAERGSNGRDMTKDEFDDLWGAP